GGGSGLENGATAGFDIAKNTVFVWTRRTSMPYKGFQPGRYINLTNDDTKLLKESIPEAKIVSPRMSLGGDFTIERGDRSASFSVYGDGPDFLQVLPMDITQGRFINPIDMDERRKVAVIGRRVHEVLYPDGEDPIGSFVNIKGIPFKVIGVFKSLSRDEAMEDEQAIYTPITGFQTAFNYGNYIGWFAMLPHDDIPAALIEQKAKSILANRHSVNPEDQRAFGSANIEEEYKQVQGIFTGIRGFSWLVAIGTIIAGVVGVGNIMMIIVKERTKEIGIRKSMGATPWSIISMILQEAVFLTGISGYLGLLVGCMLVTGVGYAVNEFNLQSDFFGAPEIHFGTALIAIVVLLIAGVIAGLIPGIRAANINPVEALRD
ncbi:MAG: ABC transporter permease, partial [Bacteroidota bacterium]